MTLPENNNKRLMTLPANNNKRLMTLPANKNHLLNSLAAVKNPHDLHVKYVANFLHPRNDTVPV